MDMNPNVKGKTKMLLQENVGEYPHGLEISKNFLF